MAAKIKLTPQEIAQHAAIYRLHRRAKQLKEFKSKVDPVIAMLIDELDVDVDTLHYCADQLRKLRKRPMPSDELVQVLGGGQGTKPK